MASVEFGRTASHLLIPSSGNVGFARLDARKEQSREPGALNRRPNQKLLCEDFGVPVNYSFSAVGSLVIYPQLGASRRSGSQRSHRPAPELTRRPTATAERWLLQRALTTNVRVARFRKRPSAASIVRPAPRGSCVETARRATER